MLDCTTPAVVKELFRVIKYVVDTKNLALKICPKVEMGNSSCNLVVYSDSAYVGDKDTQVSVSGFVIYICVSPICWWSEAQKSVTLSLSKAEWVALSEVTKEVKFIVQVIKSMGIKVRKPVIIRVDNVSAIFMSKKSAPCRELGMLTFITGWERCRSPGTYMKFRRVSWKCD
jgi:hypothetical protein